MAGFDYECELCGQKGRTDCVGAFRICGKCYNKITSKLNSRVHRSYLTQRSYKTLNDCALECGNYYNLIAMLYCLSKITECNVDDLVRTLDNIFDSRG